MKAEQPIWIDISSESTSSGVEKRRSEELMGLCLPAAVKPLDLKGVYKPGINGKVISSGGRKYAEQEVWKIKGLKKEGDYNYLTGPSLKGDSLLELIRKDKLSAAHLSILLSGISAVYDKDERKEKKETYRRVSAAGSFITSDGWLLLLPEEILEGILPLQRGEGPVWEEILENPALGGQENLIFGWSILAYRYFTNRLPFPTEGEEKELPKIRGYFSPLHLDRPELDNKLTGLIQSGLTAPGEVDPEELSDIFNKLFKEGDFNENLSDTEKEDRRVAAEKSFRKEQTRYSGKRFIRRKGTLTLLIAGILIITGGFIYTILSGVFAPPVTRGWEQREVVEAFYRGINDLDVEIVDGCETEKAGKARVEMVTSLYTISKVRMGYERIDPFINAEEWAARPDYELKEGEQLYGIRDLIVQRVSENTFRAQYQEWSSFYENDTDSGRISVLPHTQGFLIQEELDLIWKREAWMISAIRRLKTEEIDSP